MKNSLLEVRNKSYGEGYKLSFIDEFGINLSAKKVFKSISKLSGNISCLDIGCGYNAMLLKKLLPNISQGVGIDVSINKDLKDIKNLKFIESPIETAINQLSGKSFDLILIMSVLEHLNDPLLTLKRSYEHLNEGGYLFINVPTWLGKVFLEFSAFKLGLSPFYEMDDHKMYYDKKDLWPLLVKAGFKPSNIEMKYHKFGLNLFAEVKR